MVRQTFIFMLIGCLSTFVHGQTSFRVSLLTGTTDASFELGKPVWLELSTDQTTPSLETINLTELAQQFHIDQRSSVNIDPKLGRQSWHLRLYAYSTGTKIIPPLLYARWRSAPLTITITDAIDPGTRTPIKLQAELSHGQNHTAWLREQILVRYTLTSKSAYSQIQVPTYTQPGVQIRPFKLESHARRAQEFDFTLGWTLQAQQIGQLQLSLPPLQYINDGVPTHHFYPPPLTLTIKPLPIYVPATMPVGQMHISVPNHWQFTFNHSLAQFPLNISGSGIPSDQLPALANEIQSTSALRTYPVHMQAQDSFSADGIMSSASYQVPYKPITQGLLSLPPIRLSYFDPRTATVKTLQVPSIRIVSANRWLVLLLIIILLYLAYRVSAVLISLIKVKSRQVHYYYQVLQRLPKVNNAQDIRTCMALVARAETWPENLSVNQWLQRMWAGGNLYRNNLCDELNRYCYQLNTHLDIRKLQLDLRDLCIRRHPFLKLITN